MKPKNLKPHQSAIMLAGIASLAVMFLPGIHLILVPMLYLNTHIHELCHALMAEVTGGRVMNIEVYSNGAGQTLTTGGMGFLISSAGYVGAALVGALIMWRARSEGAARAVLFGLAVFLIGSMLLWVRGDSVGEVAGFVWIGVLATIIRYVKGPSLMFAAQFIGLQQCLQSFLSLNELLKISALTQGDSDARNMQNATGIPAIFWAGIWCAFSIFMVWVALRRSWANPPAPRPSRPAE